MAKIRPFCAIRPAKGKEDSVTTKSYISYSKSELELELKVNPYSFLHVLNPTFSQDKKLPAHDNQLYPSIRNRFDKFVEQEFLQTASTPCFYIYKQRLKDKFFTGIVALASVDEYVDGAIKKHEETLSKKEAALANYLDKVKINIDPVCLSYQQNQDIDELVEAYQKVKTAVSHFTSSDGIEHWLWPIKEESIIASVENAFNNVNALYIADGHHRAASSTKYALQQRKENPSFSGEEPFNYFMAVLFPESQIDIHEFNRVVTDLNGLTEEDFLSRLKSDFDIETLTKFKRPENSNKINIYINKKCWSLTIKAHCFNDKEIAKNLDSSILTEKVLKKQLGIEDLRNSKRVDFVSGTEGIEKLVNLVDAGEYKIAFALYPVTIEQIKAVADHNEYMPPKSTWIEPKLRSALTIYELNDKS